MQQEQTQATLDTTIVEADTAHENDVAQAPDSVWESSSAPAKPFAMPPIPSGRALWPKWLSSGISTGWQRIFDTLSSQEMRLHEAARKNNAGQIQHLVEKGVTVDVPYQYGRTPLMTAISHQQSDAVLCLLELGSRTDISDIFGLTPLLLHCMPPIQINEALHARITQRLTHSGLLEDKTPKGETALLLLAKAGYYTSLQFLLSAGANVQTSDNDGMTPLMYAAWNNHADMADLLILAVPAERRAAYVTQSNRWGRSALDIASHWREKTALAVLKRYTAANS